MRNGASRDLTANADGNDGTRIGTRQAHGIDATIGGGFHALVDSHTVNEGNVGGEGATAIHQDGGNEISD